MKLTKKAERLFRSQFEHGGRVSASAVHTSDGTLPLWGQLVGAGLVKPTTKIWHQFAYEITDDGRKFITHE